MAHMRRLGAGCKLRENVHTIDTEAASTAALLLHPFRPLVTSVDGAGVVRVHNYRHSTSVHRFHVTGVDAPRTCTSCQHSTHLISCRCEACSMPRWGLASMPDLHQVCRQLAPLCATQAPRYCTRCHVTGQVEQGCGRLLVGPLRCTAPTKNNCSLGPGSHVAYMLSLRVPSRLLQASPGRKGIRLRRACQCASCTSSTSCRTGS